MATAMPSEGATSGTTIQPKTGFVAPSKPAEATPRQEVSSTDRAIVFGGAIFGASLFGGAVAEALSGIGAWVIAGMVAGAGIGAVIALLISILSRKSRQ